MKQLWEKKLNFEIISFFGIMLLFTGFFTAIELFLIYFSPPKRIEINSAGNTAPLKIYTNYFFFPFRTKVTEYHTLKNVELSVNRDMVSAKKHNIYELVLHVSEKNILLKKGNRKELLSECETIIQSINSSKEYISMNNSSFNMGIVVCFFAVVLFVLFANVGPEIKMVNDEYAETIVMSYMIATVAFFIFVVSSIILNYLDKNKNNTKKAKIDDKIDNINDYMYEQSVKENNDLRLAAQKIYDSLIK